MSGFPTIPLKEEPIYIGSIQRGDHYHYDDSNNSATEQRPIPPRNCWVDVALIPANPPPRTPWPGTTSGVVTGISSVLLTQVPGNEYRYAYQGPAPQRFENMVPANYFDGAYEPTLTDAAGRVIPYDPTIWVADGYLSVIEFKRATPVSLGYRLPLTMSYWRYDGTFPGPAGGSVTALANVGTPGGDVFKTIAGSTAELRRISPNTAPGTEGIGVTTSGDDVLVGNTMTGANPSATPGAQVFANRTTDQLNFRTLVAGTNITLTQGTPTLNDITIAATGALGINAVDNVGGGAGQIFESTTLGTAHLRTVVADTTPNTEGINVATVGQTVVVGNTMEGSNPSLTPSAVDLYMGRNANLLEFRSLVAGPNITLTPTATDITIAATDTGITAIANVGTPGFGEVWKQTVANTADLRSIIPDPDAGAEGISVQTVGDDIQVGNTMVGANPSATIGPATSQLYLSRTTNQLNFRTLVAGSNITLQQGLPTADDVTIAAAASVGPTNLALFVSATGNDVTGDGTAGNPYQTLQRAFLDVRDVGYEETCEVTVQAAGGPFALPAGLLPLNQGTKGAHRVPLVIRGERTTAVAGVATTAVAAIVPTGFIEVDVAAAPGFALGQILRWTSGAAVGQEMFIAEVLSATSVRLPYSAILPSPGDTFDLLNLATELTYTQVALESFGDFLQLHDLKISSAAIPDAAFSTLNTHLFAFGIWWANNAGFGRVDHYEGNLRCGGFIPTAAATVAVPTSLGVYFDNTAPGGTLAVIGQGEKYMYNAVCHGNGSPDNTVLSGNFPVLSDCYFAAIGGIRVTSGIASGTGLWFQGITPDVATATAPGAAVLVTNNAAATFARLLLNGSTQRGIAATEDGEITIQQTNVLGTAVAAMYAARGGHVILADSPNISANPGIGYHLYDHGRLTAAAVLDASSASTGAEGIRAEGSSTINASSLVCNGNALGVVLIAGTLQVAGNAAINGCVGTNIALSLASRFTVGGNLSADASSANAGIIADQSHIVVAGNLTADGNFALGVQLIDSALTVAGLATITTNNLGNMQLTRSTLTAGSNVDVSNSPGGSGLTASGGTTMWIAGALTATGNSSTNINLGHASLLAAGDITASTSTTGSGLRIVGGSTAVSTGTVESNGSAAAGSFGIELDGGSALRVALNITASLNDGNISAKLSEIAVSGNVTADGAVATVGITLTDSAIRIGGNLTATNNQFDNVSLLRSALTAAGSADTSLSQGSSGIVAEASTIVLQGASTSTGNVSHGLRLILSSMRSGGGGLDFSTNQGTNVVLEEDSRLATTGTINADSSAGGSGVTCSDRSIITVVASMGVQNNNSNNIVLSTGSTILVTGALAADSAVSGAGITLSGGSTVKADTVSVRGNAITNLSMASDSLLLVTTGDLDASSSAGGRGIELSNAAKLIVAGNITSTGNSGNNIEMSTGAQIICGGDILADSCANGAGINATDGASIMAIVGIAATGNNGDNISLDNGARLLAVGAINTGSSTTGAGIRVLNGSQLQAVGDINSADNADSNISVETGSFLLTSNSVAASNSGSFGVQAILSSRIVILGNLTANDCGDFNVTAQSFSTITALGQVTATGSGSTNINIEEGSSLRANSGVTSSGGTIGLSMETDASLVVGTLDVSNNAGPGISLDTASKIICSSTVTAAGNNGDNISLNNGAHMLAGGSMITSGSVSGAGIRVFNGSQLQAVGDINSAGNADSNILVETGSLLLANSNVVASNSGSVGVFANVSARIVILGSLTANDCANDNISVQKFSRLFVTQLLTATGSVAANISILQGSEIQANSGVTSSGGAGGLSMVTDASLVVFGALNVSNNTGPGISLDTASKIICSVGVTANANNGNNITLANGSQIIATGIVANNTTPGSAGIGIEMRSGSRIISNSNVNTNNNDGTGFLVGGNGITASIGGCEYIGDGVSTSGNGLGSGGGVGLAVHNSSMKMLSTIIANSNFSGNVTMFQSQIVVAGNVTASSSTAGIGIQMQNSTLRAAATITASTNNSTNILLQSMSVLQTSSTLTASSSATNRGISITEASTVRITGIVTALTNTNALNGIGVELTGGSSLYTSALSNINGNRNNMIMDQSSAYMGQMNVNSATGGNGLRMTDSSLVCGAVAASITASNNVGAGISLLRSSLTATTTLTASNNTAGAGINATASDLRIGGAVTTNSNSAIGITLSQSSMRAASSVTATSNTGGNISLTQASRLIVGTAVSANSSTGIGIEISLGSNLIAVGNVTADLNANSGIRALRGCEIVCDGIMQTNGNTAGAGLIIADATVRAAGGVIATLSGATPNGSVNIQVSNRALLLSSGAIVASSSGTSSGITILDATVRAFSSITASSNAAGFGITLAEAALLTSTGSITASTNLGGINIQTGSTVRCSNTLTTSNNTGVALGQGRGVIVSGGSALVIAGGLTANANRVAALEILSASVVSQGAISATGSTAGTGITMDKGSLIGTTLTATGNNTNGLIMTNSTARADSMTATGNTGTNVDATASTIDLSDAAATSSVNGSVNGNGITCNLCKIQIVGNLTASSNAAVANGIGISATSSEISIGGNLTASSNRTAMNLIGTRLRGGGALTSITASTNTLAGIVLAAGSALTTRGAVVIASNAGIGFNAADSTVNINDQMSVAASVGTNVSLTQTTLTVGDIIANGSTGGSGISMVESRLEADRTIVTSSNQLTNFTAIASTFAAGAAFSADGSVTGTGLSLTAGSTGVVVGALSTVNNFLRGILITDSNLDVVSTITSTGNGSSGGLEMTRGSLRCGALATIHGSAGINVSLSQSTARVAALTASFAASTGTKVLLDQSTLAVVGALTANLATSGLGVSAQRGSELNCGSLALSGNAINLQLIASRCTVTGASTVSQSTATAQILANNSSLRTAGILTIGNTGANIPAAIQADNSNINLDRVDITGNHTTPLVAANASTVVLTAASGVSTMTGNASTTNLVRITNSQIDLNSLTVSGATGANPNILLTGGTRGRLTTVTAGGGAQDGIRVDGGSSIRMATIAGAGNAGTGLRVASGGNVVFTAGTMTITGASDSVVGANAAQTWATMNGGQNQHVNDFANNGPVAVVQMCTCVPA